MIKRYYERSFENVTKCKSTAKRGDEATCDVNMRNVMECESKENRNSDKEETNDLNQAYMAVIRGSIDEGGEVIALPSYVHKEDGCNVKANEELNANQKRYGEHFGEI